MQSLIVTIQAALSRCTVQDGSNVWVCGRNPEMWTIKMKATEQLLPVVLFILLYKVLLPFDSVDKIPQV